MFGVCAASYHVNVSAAPPTGPNFGVALGKRLIIRGMQSFSVLISGSCGLVGSGVALFFAKNGFHVIGIDNNYRSVFFGPEGDTSWVLERLQRDIRHYRHEHFDIRDRAALFALMEQSRPNLIVHCAAQPSHDRAASIPFLDFEVNA